MVPPQIHFIKTSSIYVALPHHYTAHHYFYYKTISCLFQKRFLLKMYLLFLGIITMYFHAYRKAFCRSIHTSLKRCILFCIIIISLSHLSAPFCALIALAANYRYLLSTSHTHRSYSAFLERV